MKMQEMTKQNKNDEKIPPERNSFGRIYNARNTAFAFVPHSILKLVPAEHDRKYIAQKLVTVINSPTGGIGAFEIELLDWISRLKYASKTMLLDLVLSGYISRRSRQSITADKISTVMNRLYKYDLIEMSRFTSVDDHGASIEEGKHSNYRIHTLGTTGYNLLKEMGRHPEKRNSFSVLADGNTVKKQLSAMQWLIYWLTHYPKRAIKDYSIQLMMSQLGQRWNRAKIYAGVTLETGTLLAEPVRRVEDFEREEGKEEIREKLERMIDMLDNGDQLYDAWKERIFFASRPVIVYVAEDDNHMEEIADLITDILAAHPHQEVWFTTDIRMFNYDCAGRRFFVPEQDELRLLDLETRTGLREMTMEERGQLAEI